MSAIAQTFKFFIQMSRSSYEMKCCKGNTCVTLGASIIWIYDLYKHTFLCNRYNIDNTYPKKMQLKPKIAPLQ